MRIAIYFLFIIFILFSCSGGLPDLLDPAIDYTPQRYDVGIFADAGTNQKVGVNETFTLDGSGSYSSYGDITNYFWSIGLYGEKVSASLSIEGIYTIKLTINDDKGNSDDDEVLIHVIREGSTNIPPIADAGGNYFGYVSNTIYLSASASFDYDGQITNYEWSCSEWGTNNKYGVSPAVVFTNPGTYTVGLKVYDDGGALGYDSAVIVISNIATTSNMPPVANAGTNQTVYVGDYAVFDGSRSSDSDGNIQTYQWSFGLEGVIVSNKYDSAGIYKVTLTVIDDDGLIDSDEVVITVLETNNTNVPPIANAGDDITIYEGDTAYFDGSASYDIDGSIVSYSWNNGINSVSGYKLYDKAGVYQVTLTVIDDDGAIGEDSVVVNVLERDISITNAYFTLSLTNYAMTNADSVYVNTTSPHFIITNMGSVPNAKAYRLWVIADINGTNYTLWAVDNISVSITNVEYGVSPTGAVLRTTNAYPLSDGMSFYVAIHVSDITDTTASNLTNWVGHSYLLITITNSGSQSPAPALYPVLPIPYSKLPDI